MKQKIYPVILVEGHFEPLGYFHKNRNLRLTVDAWLETLRTLKQIWTPGSKDGITSFEYKEFTSEEQYRRFLRDISIADSCWSDSFSRYKTICGGQVILPEQEIRELLARCDNKIPNAGKNVHLLGPCPVDCMLDFRRDTAIICGLQVDTETDMLKIEVKRISDNALFSITPYDLFDREKSLFQIWSDLPVYPFVVEKNTPSQKHLRTCFETYKEAHKAMADDYYDELRDSLNRSLAVKEEKAFELRSGSALVRWNRNLEYSWRIYDRREPLKEF